MTAYMHLWSKPACGRGERGRERGARTLKVETSRSEGGVGPANVGTEAFNGFVDFVMKPYFSWLPGSLVCLLCGMRRACLRADG